MLPVVSAAIVRGTLQGILRVHNVADALHVLDDRGVGLSLSQIVNWI